MGKRAPAKSSIRSASQRQNPAVGGPPPKSMSFKEIKRRSIIAGLRAMRAPAVVAILVNMVFGLPLPFSAANQIQHLELFAGDCAVSRSEQAEGRSVMAMDIAFGGKPMDLLTPEGFLGAVYHACRLEPGTGALAAPVCSSFVYMNKGTSKRSPDRPMGEESYPSVKAGNTLACRTLLIVMIAQALCCFWVLEQPKGSTMDLLPCFQELLRKVTVWKHKFNMQDYGAPSKKPTWIYSSHKIINELPDFKPTWLPELPPVEMAVKYVDGSGKQRVKGGSSLKASQSYPLQFGRALSKLRSRHSNQLRKDARATLKMNLLKGKNTPRNTRADSKWIKHADLGPVFDYLA